MPVKHGMCGTPTYKTWEMMIQRCSNPKFDGYSRYGGRGITVCEDWKTFLGFLKDMGVRPDKMTLDRIDVDGNYCKENCRWTNQTEQLFNKRPRRKGKRTGVYFHKQTGRWTAQINFKKTSYHLGIFDTYEEAVKAREAGEIKFYGRVKE